jgi:predicted Ser/Thr protein kinase
MQQPAAESGPLKSGTKLGPYEIVELLGAGGMGVVYRARDQRLERDVALKMLPAGALADDAARRRFRKEALVLAKLNHPHIGTIYEFATQEGMDFLVMEYIAGTTLAAKLPGGGRHRFRVIEIVDMGIQLADALAVAHDLGVIHRDLKPGNIMLAKSPGVFGRVKVLDFGLAKFAPVARASVAGTGWGENGTTAGSSLAGLIVGTVNYMSPEQLEGGPVDARSDIFAVGLVLYEVATGENPFAGRSPTSTIANILKQEPAPLRDGNPVAPAELDRILRKCLHKRPEERYQSARELWVDFSNLRRDLTTPNTGAVEAARERFAPPLPISPRAARVLFALIQLAYLIMYTVFFQRFQEAIHESARFYPPRFWGLWLSIVAACGLAVRLYLLTATVFDFEGLGRIFHGIFVGLFLLDASWAAAPLLLMGKIGGLVLLASAALAPLPFSQRSLIYTAYSPGGGRQRA